MYIQLKRRKRRIYRRRTCGEEKVLNNEKETRKRKRYVKVEWLRKRIKVYQYRYTQQHYSNWITLVVKVLFLMFVYSLFWSWLLCLLLLCTEMYMLGPKDVCYLLRRWFHNYHYYHCNHCKQLHCDHCKNQNHHHHYNPFFFTFFCFLLLPSCCFSSTILTVLFYIQL